ncbi:aspartate-alanine antiporter [Rhizobium sp. S96]|uniref:aspartate-alanine antiporter n=1 Tax=Rhizobium sp. S96 TaxID=3055140 RepID=UPI0025AAE5C3|nr:aspartate-alanine antiporter [Rhizobium sp. S96]MDM9623055.1 aspartate-alanine antiporter [Rhizobium sp. S96]
MTFLTDPVIAVFLSLSLGYFIGLAKIGPIRLGGVCGTLFVSLLIGQLGVTVSADLKNTAFALFIFALGFSAGPQFFANIRGGWRFGIFSVIEVVTALSLVAICVYVFGFDPGTAAGLFAGSATESAVLGTAGDAISRLDMSPDGILDLESNMATAYSITYLFGLVAIVLFTTQIAPLILRKNLRAEAQALAASLGSEEEEGLESGLPILVGRAFLATPLAGQSVGSFERRHGYSVVIERVKRGDELLEATSDFTLAASDIAFVLGRRDAVIAAKDMLGEEVPVPAGAGPPIATKDVVLLRRDLFGRRIEELRGIGNIEAQRGIFITRIRRLGHHVPVLPKTRLQEGDVITLQGSEALLNGAATRLGKALPSTTATDLMFMGLGIVVGLLVGRLAFKTGALELTLGAGGGALISGLFFGWLNMRYPNRAYLPPPAAEFAKEFGLATFIAAIGLAAGPGAIALIAEYGLILPVLGAAMSLTPALVSLFVGWKLMKIEMPILLGVIAGQHCSTPTISALVSQAGNATPVIGYTVTYAISNVLLPLVGPVVIALAESLARSAS